MKSHNFSMTCVSFLQTFKIFLDLKIEKARVIFPGQVVGLHMGQKTKAST